MTYVVTFQNAQPSVRAAEAGPWTQVRIDESSTGLAPWTALKTQDLDPVDADPENPAQRDITTTLATLETGWYRLAFIDADGNSEVTAAVHRGVHLTFATAEDIAARLGPGRDLTDAEEDQVALLLELATDLIIEAAREDQDWADDLIASGDYAVYRLICIEVVYRALLNPGGVESQTETLGAYSHTQRYGSNGSSSFGLFLTRDERRRLRSGTGSFLAITLESPYSGTSLDDLPELPL